MKKHTYSSYDSGQTPKKKQLMKGWVAVALTQTLGESSPLWEVTPPCTCSQEANMNVGTQLASFSFHFYLGGDHSLWKGTANVQGGPLFFSSISGNASQTWPCLPEGISSVDTQGEPSHRPQVYNVFLPVTVALAGLPASVLRPLQPLHLSSWMLGLKELQRT